MAQVEIPNNSFANKKQTEVVEAKKVVKPLSTETKPKTLKERVTDSVSPSIMKKIGGNIMENILIPSALKIADEVITVTKNIILYGDSSNRNVGNQGNQKIQYNRVNYGNPTYSNNKPVINVDRKNSVAAIADHTFASRQDAMEVLSQLSDILERFDKVKVLDYYDVIQTTCDHTAQNFGWTSLANADVYHTVEGWKLRLPRPKEIR